MKRIIFKNQDNSIGIIAPTDEALSFATKEQKEAASKRLKGNNPMYNKEVVDKIKKAKEGTINCFDIIEQKFVRICVNLYNSNKDRYKNNNSKEAKKFKESEDVK